MKILTNKVLPSELHAEISKFLMLYGKMDIDFSRAVARDLWHIGVTHGLLFLRVYLNYKIFRKTIDLFRLVKCLYRFKIEYNRDREPAKTVYFIHHAKYKSKLDDDGKAIHIYWKKHNTGFHSTIANTFKTVNFRSDFLFLEAIDKYLYTELYFLSQCKEMVIFEGDAALTSLIICNARKANLRAKLIQWGHVTPMKSLVAFSDIGVDDIVCDNVLIADKLKKLNGKSKITVCKIDYLRKKRLLFIDQGVSEIVNKSNYIEFLNMASLLAHDDYHVDVKLHPNNGMNIQDLVDDKVGIIAGGNIAESYFFNYDAVIGIYSSSLVYAADAGLKTFSFNPDLYDSTLYDGCNVREVKDISELRKALVSC